MKKLVEVQEIEGAGMIELLGQKVVLLCMVYIYTGKIVGVDENFVELEDPSIIYETGAWSDSTWKDAQPLCVPKCCVNLSAIEAFAAVDK